MQTRYVGEILAMLLVGGSASILIHLDSQGILSCVPLLVGLYAIHRGATWAAFAVLAGATGLLTLTIAGRAPWLLSIGAGSAVVPTLVVLPSLWRFDRLATQILAGIAFAVGIACALLSYSKLQAPASAENAWPEPPGAFEPDAMPTGTKKSRPTVNEVVELPANLEAPAACDAADLVGIYDLADLAKGSLRLGADFTFIYSLGDGSRRRGTFSIAEREVMLTTIDGQIERIGCSLENDGRFTLDGRAVWEVAR